MSVEVVIPSSAAQYDGIAPQGWGSVISRSRSYSRGTAGFVNFSGSSSGYNYLTALSGMMTTYVFKIVASAMKIKIAYGAFAYGTDVGTTVPIGQVTVEYPHASGTFFDVTFGGSGTVTLNNGQVVISDTLDLTSAGGVVAGQLMNVRTWVATSSGLNTPTFDDQNTAAGASDKVSTAANQCHTAYASLSSTSTAGYGPCGIFGNSGKQSVALVGDSITQGVGDTVFPSPHVHAGWADRAFNNTMGLVSVSRHAERGDQWNSSVLKHRRGLAYSCGRVLCAYGNNDIYTATALTADQLQHALIPVWREFRTRGAKVWATTITPRTTSSDTWATGTNQTITSGNTVRVAVNQWLRDGAPIDINGQAAAVGATGVFRAGDKRHPLESGIIDISGAIETATDSGKWKNVADTTTGPWTADGTHPTPLGHSTMGALITVSNFA